MYQLISRHYSYFGSTETQETVQFTGVFRGYEMRRLTENLLNYLYFSRF